MHKVVVGTGYTGKRVLDSLPGATGISRSRRPGFGDRRIITCDLDDPAIDPVVFEEAFALLYTVPPARDSIEDKRLARLLNAFTRAPSRIVYISTSAVYGDHGGHLIDESTPPAPALPRSRRRFAAERLLVDYCANTNAALVVLRVPGIYGPYRLGLKRIEDQVAIIREQDAHPGNRIHVDDLAACCIAALDDEAVTGVINVGDGDYRSGSWFTNQVAAMAGLPAPPQISREQALATFSPKRLSFLSEARKLDTRRMREDLGVTPLYADPLAGIRASLLEEGRTPATEAPAETSDD